MSFDQFFDKIDLKEIYNYVSKNGVKGTVKNLTEGYKSAVIMKHTFDNVGETMGLAFQYPEIAGTMKYNFNEMAQLVNITATIANDSKVDLRKVPKKIGSVDLKVKRYIKRPKAG